MSQKRSRAAFEADLQAQQSPYVLFGTALPPLDPEVRDDGSYVPVWKQEVRDDRGRKRLHGAFTGGFSAGYFNTVGSKEGWAPSTFVSSRTNRWKKDDGSSDKTPQGQRLEDFMDEEDLADAAEDEKLQTARGFAGFGAAGESDMPRGRLAELFRTRGETMGVKLLKRMGWKEGQGIGPKIRRKARLGTNGKWNSTGDAEVTHFFAPDNVPMVALVKKLDRKGIGFQGESSLTLGRHSGPKAGPGWSSEDEDGDDDEGPLTRMRQMPRATKKRGKTRKTGIGIGILNDTGSDDEDPYEIGPKISYNRVIGGDKKKKNPTTTAINPALNSAPVFRSRKSQLAKSSKTLRKCHDGRLPLDGFVFGSQVDTLTSSINSAGKYPPPSVPPGWKSAKLSSASSSDGSALKPYMSTADAAKASILDPKARAAVLGEAQLPGKSVFDFLSPEARERLASATGKSNLPPALGEIPEGYALSEVEKRQALLNRVPKLDKDTAIAAISRGASGGGIGGAPYADNEEKRSRYRAYLEFAAGFTPQTGEILFASRPSSMRKDDDWLRELQEFHNCARIFKPMSGLMASRFTTSTTTTALPGSSTSGGQRQGGSGGNDGSSDPVSKPAPKPANPAEEAAKAGMYGSLTRSTTTFYPTRLLCKRFGVRPPAHVAPDADAATKAHRSHNNNTSSGAAGPGLHGMTMGSDATVELMKQMAVSASTAPTTAAPVEQGAVSSSSEDRAVTLDDLMRQTQEQVKKAGGDKNSVGAPPPAPAPDDTTKVDANVNHALEGQKAHEQVLRDIFGDSSDDDE